MKSFTVSEYTRLFLISVLSLTIISADATFSLPVNLLFLTALHPHELWPPRKGKWDRSHLAHHFSLVVTDWRSVLRRILNLSPGFIDSDSLYEWSDSLPIPSSGHKSVECRHTTYMYKVPAHSLSIISYGLVLALLSDHKFIFIVNFIYFIVV